MDDANNKDRRRGGFLALLLVLGLGSRRGCWYYLLLGGAILGMILTAATAFWYFQTRQPLSEAPIIGRLPGVSAASAAPPFLFSIYGLNRPRGVAVSPGGERIYAVDTEGEREVRVFDRSGKQLGSLKVPDLEAGHWNPSGIAVDPQGRVYIADSDRGVLDTFGPDGAYRAALRPAGSEWERWIPFWLAFDGRGNLYVTEISPGKHRVLILDTDGHVRAQFGKEGKGNGELSFPTGIAVDGSGLIYVADGNNGRVVTLDPVSGFGEPLHAPAGFNLPRGLSMLNGQLLVSDTTGQRVLAFSLGGVPRFLYSFGDEGAMDGQFEYPEGVAVDSTGRVYVADRMNDRIQVFGWR